MAGRNRYSGPFQESLSKSLDACVFISHASYYDEVARAVGRYLTEVVQVDVYLALQDRFLAAAVHQDDHGLIVKHIEIGLATSTHMFALIGEETKNSWWVPFELGEARALRKPTGCLLLDDVDYLPSFLRIATILESDRGLRNWVRRQFTKIILEKSLHPLDDFPMPSIPRIPATRQFTRTFV